MERVLFVDDEPILLRAHVRAFQKRYRVETAESGDAALPLLTRAVADDDPFAVMIADFVMPKVSGTVFLERAHTESPRTVLIVLSGMIDLEVPSCVSVTLQKPCRLEDLRLAIENAAMTFRLP